MKIQRFPKDGLEQAIAALVQKHQQGIHETILLLLVVHILAMFPIGIGWQSPAIQRSDRVRELGMMLGCGDEKGMVQQGLANTTGDQWTGRLLAKKLHPKNVQIGAELGSIYLNNANCIE